MEELIADSMEYRQNFETFKSNIPFTKENLNTYLKKLAKEFRKLNGTKMPAEIILIGGAAILANYGFRELTYDIDVMIMAFSVMIRHVALNFYVI